MAGVLLPARAEAKIVELRWSEVQGAKSYEMEIQPIKSATAKSTVVKLSHAWWKGELNFGSYAYRVRAIDKIQRSGFWSAHAPLVVTPPAPEAKGPESGVKIAYYGKAPGLKLEWTPVRGVSKFFVELMRAGAPFASDFIDATEKKMPALPDGSYSWRVSSVVPIPDHPAFSELNMREWKSQPSVVAKFDQVKSPLKEPELRYPLGRQEAPREGLLSFQWDPTPGASRYEVTLEEIQESASGGRSPASVADARPIHSTVVDAGQNQISIPSPRAGPHYRWKVRAIAGEEIGPESMAEFQLDVPVVFVARGGWIKLTPAVYPFTYTTESTTSPKGTLTGDGLAANISGFYWALPNWGIGANVENRMFSLNASSFTRVSFDIWGARRWSLGLLGIGRKSRSWVSTIYGGFGFHQLFDFAPNSNVILPLASSGPSAKLEFEGPIAPRTGMLASIGYFIPLSANSSSASGHTLSILAEVNYKLRTDLRLGMGIQHEMLRLKYSSNQKQVELSGQRFFMSLTYAFGQDFQATPQLAKQATQ